MQTLRTYLQLVRLPAVFTAMADIFLGFLLTQLTLAESLQPFGFLLTASACLYMAGMVFNDVFDRKADSTERSHRPIPSGRVSAAAAVMLGVLLMAVGNVAAGFVGPNSLLIAGVLSTCVLAYDGFLKRTPLGPVAMGSCRLLNVMLGASTSIFVWARPQIYVAAALGVYAAGITWFARSEAVQSSRSQLAAAAGVVLLGLAGLMAFVVNWPGAGNVVQMFVVLAGLTFAISIQLVRAIRDPVPERVQTAVRTMVLSIILLDAAVVFFKTGQPMHALVMAALLIPALTLGRWIFIT